MVSTLGAALKIPHAADGNDNVGGLTGDMRERDNQISPDRKSKLVMVHSDITVHVDEARSAILYILQVSPTFVHYLIHLFRYHYSLPMNNRWHILYIKKNKTFLTKNNFSCNITSHVLVMHFSFSFVAAFFRNNSV